MVSTRRCNMSYSTKGNIRWAHNFPRQTCELACKTAWFSKVVENLIFRLCHSWCLYKGSSTCNTSKGLEVNILAKTNLFTFTTTQKLQTLHRFAVNVHVFSYLLQENSVWKKNIIIYLGLRFKSFANPAFISFQNNGQYLSCITVCTFVILIISWGTGDPIKNF